jgi:hypothetical protein
MLLAGEIYNKTITQDLLTIYFELLVDYRVGQVAAAIKAHLVDPEYGTFFPKPADIVRHIQGKRDEGATFRQYIHEETKSTPMPDGFMESRRKLI